MNKTNTTVNMKVLHTFAYSQYAEEVGLICDCECIHIIMHKFYYTRHHVLLNNNKLKVVFKSQA